MRCKRKITERDIMSFIVEFVRKVDEIDEELIPNSDCFLHFGKRRIYLCSIYEAPVVEDYLSFFEEEFEYVSKDVKEAAHDYGCVACLCGEDSLVSQIYGYLYWGEDNSNGSAGKLYNALNAAAGKYGLYCEVAGGIITLYDEEEWGSEEMDVHEILEREVINDYFTPAVKAEVMIDTILTPVISEIITEVLAQKKNLSTRIQLLAKEFPLLEEKDELPLSGKESSIEEELSEDSGKGKTYLSCNADYLMYDHEYVYFVELKTTRSSIEQEQMKNYIKHCKSEKRFGEKEGFDFIRLLNHVSRTGKSELDKNMPEITLETLRNLFWDIIYYPKRSKRNTKETNVEIWDTYASLAKEYLIKEQAYSSKKYLFTAGQMLDSKEDGRYGEWWDYEKRKVIYIVPASEDIDCLFAKPDGSQLDREDWEKYGMAVTFQEIIESADVIQESIDDLSLKQYWDWVVGILKEIMRNKTENMRDE